MTETADLANVPDADDVAREARLAAARRHTERALRKAERQRREAKAARDVERRAARAAEATARKAARLAAQRTLSETERAEAYTCVLCHKSFATIETFRAHHIHKFTPIERCLDSQELTALDFRRSKAGLWSVGIATQLLASQIARLATVRQEREAFIEAGGYLGSTHATPFDADARKPTKTGVPEAVSEELLLPEAVAA